MAFFLFFFFIFHFGDSVGRLVSVIVSNGNGGVLMIRGIQATDQAYGPFGLQAWHALYANFKKE